jgi:large subunit ribosomal protein L11
MAEVKLMVEGGKATAGPPLGPSLAPLGVNIGQIVSQINEKTKGYAGMKVPVVVEVDKSKNVTINVGSPPTSALILKEAKASKGGANQKTDKVGNLTMQQVKKLAEMKINSLSSSKIYSAVREIVGTCNSMGVTIEGKPAKEIQKEIKSGKWDDLLKN